METQEKILCAAIHYPDVEPLVGFKNNTGYISLGHRHMQAMIQAKITLSALSIMDLSNSVQGFLTSQNRFVDRAEAYQIAKESGQILDNRFAEVCHNTRELYSENLY